MFAWLLNLAYLAFLAAVSPVLLFRIVARGKYRTGWGQKLLGRVPWRAGNRPCLWLHAVSVGEVLQLAPLLAALEERNPGLELVISTTTATGFDVAQKRYPGRPVFYFPLDFSWAVNEALSRIKPSAIALVELELWPNFIFAAAARRIPLALVNGRISQRSFRGYRRIRPLIGAILRKIVVLAVQSDTYANRLAQLGAAPNQIHVTGSIKFDSLETNRDNPRTAELRRTFDLRDSETVFIAGSTQAPEERFALESYVQLKVRFPNLRLILVPRHKERFEEVASLVEREFGLPLVRRSRLFVVPDSAGIGDTGVSTVTGSATDSAGVPPSGGLFAGVGAVVERAKPVEGGTANAHGTSRRTEKPVLLLDTLGELSACWGLAQIAFVGGSLTHRGGQNMMEPAGYGAAVLFGPNTWNFKDVVELLLASSAAQVVADRAELTARLEDLLLDPAKAAAMGAQAQSLVLAQRGSTARTVDLLSRVLPPEPSSGIVRAA